MRPYILLTVDSLRADAATKDFLPESLSILHKDYVNFSRAYSYGVATPFAFPGIVAATHPIGDGKIDDTVTTLAERLPGTATAYPNNEHLSSERGYDRGVDRFRLNPAAGSSDGLRSIADQVVGRLKQVDTLRNSDTVRRLYGHISRTVGSKSSLPVPYDTAPEMVQHAKGSLKSSPRGLLWAHWMDPHTPYHPETAVGGPDSSLTPEELADINDRVVAADASALSADELALQQSLYEANVRYFDDHFSKLLRWLQDQPWYDDAVVAIVSDHGEYFGEHGQLFHTWDIDPYDEAIKTPLWIKYPNQEDAGTTYDHPVGHGDLLATMAKIADPDAKLPRHVAPLREASERHIVSVSNTSKRLTESGGTRIVRRDGTTVVDGRVSTAGEEFLDSIEFPECVNFSGDAQGVEEAERRKRLQQLGYR